MSVVPGLPGPVGIRCRSRLIAFASATRHSLHQPTVARSRREISPDFQSGVDKILHAFRLLVRADATVHPVAWRRHKRPALLSRRSADPYSRGSGAPCGVARGGNRWTANHSRRRDETRRVTNDDRTTSQNECSLGTSRSFAPAERRCKMRN